MIVVAKATHEDVDRLGPLFDSYRQFYGQDSDLIAARRFLSMRLKQKESTIFFATQGSFDVGFTQLYPSFSSVSMRQVWILNDLFVDQTARRQGIATALMTKAIEFARETGAVRLALATGKENSVAQSLYERLGWEYDDGFLHFQFNL